MSRFKIIEERLICETYRASTIPRISENVMNGDFVIGVSNNYLKDIDIYKTSIVPNPAFLEGSDYGYIKKDKRRFSAINYNSHYVVGAHNLVFTFDLPTIAYSDACTTTFSQHTFLAHYVADLLEQRYTHIYSVNSERFLELTVMVKLPEIINKNVMTSIKTYLLNHKMYKLKFLTPTKEQTERYLFKYGYKCLDFNDPIWGGKDEI